MRFALIFYWTITQKLNMTKKIKIIRVSQWKLRQLRYIFRSRNLNLSNVTVTVKTREKLQPKSLWSHYNWLSTQTAHWLISFQCSLLILPGSIRHPKISWCFSEELKRLHWKAKGQCPGSLKNWLQRKHSDLSCHYSVDVIVKCKFSKFRFLIQRADLNCFYIYLKTQFFFMLIFWVIVL